MYDVNIVVSDDCPVFRDGITGALQKFCPLYPTFKASGNQEALQLMEKLSINLIFLELKVPILKSFESVRILKSANPDVKVVVISLIRQESIIKKLFDDGISGYIYKNSNWSNLLSIVQLINLGNMYISPEILVQFDENNSEVQQTNSNPTTDGLLSKNEKRLIEYMCHQLGHKEISEIMEIDEKTLEQLKIETMKKTNTKNMIGLAIYAIQHGLIKSKDLPGDSRE